MTEQEALFPSVAQRRGEALRTQLAAVELLLARTDRTVAYNDILVATCLELLLGHGPLSTQELHGRAISSWPGLHLTLAQLDAAMRAAELVENVRHERRPGQSGVWSLLPAGRAQLPESNDRGAQIVARFRAQLASEARRLGTSAVDNDLNAISDLVVGMIRSAVADCFRIPDSVSLEHIGGWLRIGGADLDAMEAQLWRRLSEERAEIVMSLVRTSLDPTVASGSELVHHLVSGHVLYLFMCRPDEVRAASQAGSLSDETLLLDTPVLLRMAGPSEQQKPIVGLVAKARHAGMRVLMMERTVDEFSGHLDTCEASDVLALDDAIRKGAEPFVLSAGQRGSDAVRSWLAWADTQPIERRRWSDFRAHVEGPEGVVSVLTAIGVERTSDERWYDDVSDAAELDAFRRRLEARLSTPDGIRRGPKQIEHDAHLLHALSRERRANPASDAKIWPGGFILTTDRQVDDVFELQVGEQQFPAALTVSHLAQIVSAYASPEDAEQLALEGAQTLLDSQLISRASVIPADLAHTMAMAIASEAPSPAEVEQLTIQLREVMSGRSDELEHGSEAHATLVRDLVDQQRKRRRAIDEEESNAQEAERTRSAVEADRQERALQQKDDTIRQLSAELSDMRTAETALDDGEAGEHGATDHRRSGVLVATTVAVCVGAFLLFSGSWLGGGAVLIAGIALYSEGQKWANGGQGLTSVITAVVIAAVSVVSLA